jgi:hypothetical protein
MKTDLEKAITALYLEIDESIIMDLKQKIRQAKSEWCKSQRENCANVFYENKALPYNLKMLIQNAPEPV